MPTQIVEGLPSSRLLSSVGLPLQSTPVPSTERARGELRPVYTEGHQTIVGSKEILQAWFLTYEIKFNPHDTVCVTMVILSTYAVEVYT